MSASGGDVMGLWKFATYTSDDTCMKKLESVEDGDKLNALGNALRYGFCLPVNKAEAVRWYRKAAELDVTDAIVNLGLCYENGEGVESDLAEAAKFYRLAADRGSTDAMLSLGLFHWCGLGCLESNRSEAQRYWQMAGFELGDVCPSVEIDTTDPTLFCVEKPDDEISVQAFPLPEADCDRDDDLREEEELRIEEDNRCERFQAVRPDTGFELAPSFELWNAGRIRSIESVVLFDGNRSVRDLLTSSPRPSVSELSLLIAEGILREGNRCLDGPRDSDNGKAMYDELIVCCDLPSVLRLCANFYTRATFLYRCVNKFMRETTKQDEETGRNIGIYIGFLRECFCVREGLGALEWNLPQRLYRGANFPIGVIVDYARRQGENIWWQGFTSSSSDVHQARKFQGNVMFEIILTDPAPSLSGCSAFPQEQEFILNPYQRFTLDGVRWSNSTGRWIIQVGGSSSPDQESWFGQYLS
jgi:hypothetical protein